MINSGVPVGTQVAWLSSSNNGWPFEVSRVAAVVHCAVTQGGWVPDDSAGSVQPATIYDAATVTVGMPITFTRGFGTVGCAWPA